MCSIFLVHLDRYFFYIRQIFTILKIYNIYTFVEQSAMHQKASIGFLVEGGGGKGSNPIVKKKKRFTGPISNCAFSRERDWSYHILYIDFEVTFYRQSKFNFIHITIK